MPDLLERFAPLFKPRTVAVFGASAKRMTLGGLQIKMLNEQGFAGRIYPVHPEADTIGGLKAYPDASHLPETIDYAYVAVPSDQVLDVVRGLAGRCRFAQIIAAGFGETGTDGKAREAELLAAARAGGIRLLGPNSIGLYVPASKLSYMHTLSYEPGSVSLMIQSGGLGGDVMNSGEVMGMRFSKVAHVGNALDLGPAELLSYFAADPETAVIGIHMETVKEGRAFFLALQQAAAVKPVVILKGGMTAGGQVAAASHTGALASDARVFQGLCRQTGTVLVDTPEAFVATLAAFERMPSLAGNRTILVGSGGGISVLAADACHRAGLALPKLSAAAQQKLVDMGLPAGNSFENPIDLPNWTITVREGEAFGQVLDVLLGEPVDLVIAHINLTVLQQHPARARERLAELAAEKLAAMGPGPRGIVVVRSSGHEELAAQRQRMIEVLRQAGAVVQFDVMESIAVAGRLLWRHRHREARRPGERGA